MYAIGKISVTAVIPEKLKMLEEIANNLWWSWNSDAIDLYREIDLALWEKVNKNPIRFLQEVSQEKLDEKLKNPTFYQKYEDIVSKFKHYLNEKNTWYSRNNSAKKDHMIAYFSAEYGLNEVLPIYSGGLGVLSGDHCKSASDLGLPFVAIGLFYKQGYFSQHINRDGWQETEFNDLNTSHLPVSPALDKNGNQIVINVELPGRIAYASVWQVKIGRVNLYLMDTDVPQNSAHDRWLTARLYGGDEETRIQQEIFLGIGGIRILDALGLAPTVYHMNEGHSSFLGLELIRKLISDKGLNFKEAKEVVTSCTVFTTHTPVPAGNDAFPLTLIDKYFSNFWPSLGINRHEFLDLGLKISEHNNFNMTVLALSIAGHKNGVSELHGAVSRNIFNNVWPSVPEDEVPIGHITNGIHTLTWMSPSIRTLYDKFVAPDWSERLHEKSTIDKVDNIPDEDLWKTHCVLKTKMITFVREKLKKQRISNGESIERIRETETLLNTDALTFGFARRFATYKRAHLIFRNLVRIQNLLNNPKMPMQIIFAGKAHPADRPAHEVIKQINDIAAQEGFRGKVVLLENYNMTVARNLVQGVDVWLNNPRRPLEASGTSGQKVAINGILNFSILDGWWVEGYNGKNGWAIGDETAYENDYYQDNADSESIYQLLENEVIPLFYDRNENGVPTGWVKMMKEAMKSLTYTYSTSRMVTDYFQKMYFPCIERMEQMQNSNFSFAKDISTWKQKMDKIWPNIQIIAEKNNNLLQEQKSQTGDKISVAIQVYLDTLLPKDVQVELYYGRLKNNQKIENAHIVQMTSTDQVSPGTYKYEVTVNMVESGELGYTFRILPNNPDLINVFDTGYIKWIL